MDEIKYSDFVVCVGETCELINFMSFIHRVCYVLTHHVSGAGAGGPSPQAWSTPTTNKMLLHNNFLKYVTAFANFTLVSV